MGTRLALWHWHLVGAQTFNTACERGRGQNLLTALSGLLRADFSEEVPYEPSVPGQHGMQGRHVCHPLHVCLHVWSWVCVVRGCLYLCMALGSRWSASMCVRVRGPVHPISDGPELIWGGDVGFVSMWTQKPQSRRPSSSTTGPRFILWAEWVESGGERGQKSGLFAGGLGTIGPLPGPAGTPGCTCTLAGVGTTRPSGSLRRGSQCALPPPMTGPRLGCTRRPHLGPGCVTRLCHQACSSLSRCSTLQG